MDATSVVRYINRNLQPVRLLCKESFDISTFVGSFHYSSGKFHYFPNSWLIIRDPIMATMSFLEDRKIEHKIVTKDEITNQGTHIQTWMMLLLHDRLVNKGYQPQIIRENDVKDIYFPTICEKVLSMPADKLEDAVEKLCFRPSYFFFNVKKGPNYLNYALSKNKTVTEFLKKEYLEQPKFPIIRRIWRSYDASCGGNWVFEIFLERINNADYKALDFYTGEYFNGPPEFQRSKIRSFARVQGGMEIRDGTYIYGDKKVVENEPLVYYQSGHLRGSTGYHSGSMEFGCAVTICEYLKMEGAELDFRC